LAWRVVGAINAGLGEEMHFPINNEPALNKLEERFRARWGINSAFMYKGVVGAIDGLVIKIKRPCKRLHKCPQAFFCGRYKCFGIAFQVIVGPDCEFLWSYGNAPGSVHDSVAFGMSRLYSKLRGGEMDAKYHLAGDGAYCDEPWLFTPYPEPRSGKLSADKDTFNWVHSSHRQCVERAFGARPPPPPPPRARHPFGAARVPHPPARARASHLLVTARAPVRHVRHARRALADPRARAEVSAHQGGGRGARVHAAAERVHQAQARGSARRRRPGRSEGATPRASTTHV